MVVIRVPIYMNYGNIRKMKGEKKKSEFAAVAPSIDDGLSYGKRYSPFNVI